VVLKRITGTLGAQDSAHWTPVRYGTRASELIELMLDAERSGIRYDAFMVALPDDDLQTLSGELRRLYLQGEAIERTGGAPGVTEGAD
jgi:hypothetical protein